MIRPDDLPVRTLLVDDHAIVRERYRQLLERHGQIVVVGEAADGPAAYALFCVLRPQVVVMDLRLGAMSGIEAMRRILNHDPSARVVIFSLQEDAIFERYANAAGAVGYVTKTNAPSTLVTTVLSVTDVRGRGSLA